MSEDDIVKFVAAALRDRFMETVERSSGMPFQDTGVSVPKDAVWESYAERAIEAYHDALRKLADETEPEEESKFDRALKEAFNDGMAAGYERGRRDADN
jgi:flagellar biosynthesis/type III secretory pathway protein FliH